MTANHPVERLVVLAPNWLGDAVMALPALADVRRALPAARLAVAARRSVAPLFRLAAGVDEVVPLESRRWRDAGAALADGRFDAALLLPNSFHSAFAAFRARIPERWGYRTDWRGGLLTRAIDRPAAVHQAAYYQHLTRALGFPDGPPVPRIAVDPDAAARAAALLEAAGWDRVRPLAAIAPGAAYGGAKRWPAASFAALARELADDRVQTVVVGSAADRPAADAVLRRYSNARNGAAASIPLVNVVGATDLATLAGVFAMCRTLVTNDSGAMHFAAAVGTPVTAVFGPTDERATRPIGDEHVVVTGDAWCRPCMLRECPIDHRCMRSIAADRVAREARRTL